MFDLTGENTTVEQETHVLSALINVHHNVLLQMS
jgi:hypothetical protein